jgi:uncharacterized membrane protein required for colicin V production
MTSVIATIVVILIVGLSIYGGLRDGAVFTLYTTTRNAFAFLCAMTFCQPMARVLMKLLTSKHPAYDYFVVLSFVAIFGAVFAIARWLKVRFTIPYVHCPKPVDRSVGPTVGLLNGVVVTGMLLVLWSLLPFARYLPGDLGRVRVSVSALDTGLAMLKFYDFVEDRMGGSRLFLLRDEPLTFDPDENGRYDPRDRYDDLNRNGRWDRGWIWRYRNYAEITSDDLRAVLGSLQE